MSTKSYIITLREGADPSELKDSIQKHGGTVVHELSLINGLSVQLKDEPQLASIKALHSDVIEDVEEDQEMHILGSG